MQEIKYIDINLLKSHPNNPRTISDVQFKILCESIAKNKDYFEARPILCNKDMVIFAGNMRFRAAKEVGMTEVPVCVMDISEDRQNEIMIRDNKQNGIWDFDILANNYEPVSLLEYGFTEQELHLGSFGGEAEKSGECQRCAELKKQVEGHHGRSGHDPMKEKKE